MNDKQIKPREYDLVLGGNNPPPTDGLVLGGIEGVKQRLASEDIQIRIAAISNALKYDKPGLNLVIDALYNESELIQDVAYDILRSHPDSEIKTILEEYNNTPCLRFDGLYEFFYYYHSHEFHHNRYNYYYLKFYQDRTVLSITRLQDRNNKSSINYIKKINSLFAEMKQDTSKPIGNYAIERNYIKFFTTHFYRNSYVNFDYWGNLYRKNMILDIYSPQQSYTTRGREYKFIKVF